MTRSCQYQRLFSLNQVILGFTNGAIRQVAKRCMSGCANGPSDGARGLRRVMEEILEGPQVKNLKVVPNHAVRCPWRLCSICTYHRGRCQWQDSTSILWPRWKGQSIHR